MWLKPVVIPSARRTWRPSRMPGISAGWYGSRITICVGEIQPKRRLSSGRGWYCATLSNTGSPSTQIAS